MIYHDLTVKNLGVPNIIQLILQSWITYSTTNKTWASSTVKNKDFPTTLIIWLNKLNTLLCNIYIKVSEGWYIYSTVEYNFIQPQNWYLLLFFYFLFIVWKMFLFGRIILFNHYSTYSTFFFHTHPKVFIWLITVGYSIIFYSTFFLKIGLKNHYFRIEQHPSFIAKMRGLE